MFFPVLIYFGFLDIYKLNINKIATLPAVRHTDTCSTFFAASFASFHLYVMGLSCSLLLGWSLWGFLIDFDKLFDALAFGKFQSVIFLT